MGPSGAGKYLIALIKHKAERPLLLPSRYITRPVNAAELEQHQFMTPEAFAAAEQVGEFACRGAPMAMLMAWVWMCTQVWSRAKWC